MDTYRPVRRSAIASRLLTNALVRKGLLGRKGRYQKKAPVYKKAYRTASGVAVQKRQPRKLKIQKVKQTPGLTSHSLFSLTRAPDARTRTRKRVGAPNFYTTNFPTQIIASEGLQAIGFQTWNSSADMNFILQRLPQAQAPGVNVNRSFVLEQCHGEILFTNSSLASCYVEVYDIARRRDADVTKHPATANPLSAWSQGITDNQPSGSPSTLQDLKSIPFDSQLFKDWFKVCKRTRFELSQGATHRHAVTLNPNRTIDESVVAYSDGDMAGITMYTMWVVYGQPASVPQGDAPAVVTTAKIALDSVAMLRYKYTWVSDLTQTQYFQDNLNTLTGEQIASPGLGDIILNKVV